MFKVNLRYQNSFANDPDLMINVNLANVLIFNDDSLTPWTNISLVGVPGITYYKNDPENGYAISANASLSQFANAINNMEFDFTFDWAVAIMKYIILNDLISYFADECLLTS
jgi:hypothetical protein